MEERVPHATAAAHHHHDLDDGDPRFRHRYRHNDNASDDNHNHNHNHHGMQIDPSNDNNIKKISPDGRPLQTYIVQVPKDQIYRVPPPEHAKIVERYRNPAGKRRQVPQCMTWCLSIFFTLACLISIIICIHHFTLNPNPPTFSVKHIELKHPKKNGSTQFHITVGTENPNSNNDVEYENGSATLKYKEKEVAKGNFPSLDSVGPGKSEGVDVVLKGSSKEQLPEKPKSPVNLDLKMSVPVKMKTWLFTKNKEMSVACEFEVTSLGENPKVLSQSCANED